jgi:hypothetical protein
VPAVQRTTRRLSRSYAFCGAKNRDPRNFDDPSHFAATELEFSQCPTQSEVNFVNANSEVAVDCMIAADPQRTSGRS